MDSIKTRKKKYTIIGLIIVGLTSFLSYCTIKAEPDNFDFEESDFQYVETNKGIYFGSVENDRLTGKGEIFYFDGDQYEGGVVDGLKYGTGELKKENGNKYEGAYKDDHFSGTGTYTFSDGTVYKGEFVDGKRSGKCVIQYANGDAYDGLWKNDIINGVGEYTYANGSVLKGDFKENGFIKGYCQMAYGGNTVRMYIEDDQLTGRVWMETKDGDTFDGLYSGENGYQGECKITYKNGDEYNGDVKNNLKNGKGTYKWTGGAHYDGMWASDQMNGAGKYYFSSGESKYIEGTFLNNKPNGVCTYHKDASTSYKTTWKNGMCTAISK